MLYQKILLFLDLLITICTVYNATVVLPVVPKEMRVGGIAFLTGVALLLGDCINHIFPHFKYFDNSWYATLVTIRCFCWFVCSGEFAKSLHNKVIKF